MGGEEEGGKKSKWKKALGHIGLFVALMAYTALGGIVFKELEYPTEVSHLSELDAQVRQHRNQFLQSVAEHFNVSENQADFLDLLQQELHKYEGVVQEAAGEGVLVPLSEGTAPAAQASWSHIQAIFFASTVLTTIGYGNIVPVTVSGRSFCIVFAIIGIPLALSVIADLGALVAASLPSVPSWLSSQFSSSSTLKSLFTAAAALILLLVYLAVGAFLFMMLEDDWDFFESFYFCFITMTTIGFGDLVPKKPQYMLLCTVYILVGLSLTSTIIELVRLEYAKSWKRLQELAEALRRLGEEGGQIGDTAAFQNDLKKLLGLMSGKQKNPSDWDDAVKNIVQNMSKPKPQPKIIQIVIYETSV